MHWRRQGFTLVETLVALTLLAVGMTAWVTTSAVAIRLAAAGERETAAHNRIRARAERLAGGTCAAAVSGNAGADSWTVTPLANGVRLIHVESRFIAERRERLVTFDLMMAC